MNSRVPGTPPEGSGPGTHEQDPHGEGSVGVPVHGSDTFHFLQFDESHQHDANGKVTFEGEITDSGHGELDFEIELFPPDADLQAPGKPLAGGSGVLVLDRIAP